jgi:branched-chain amino acid transport system ATP-binding protein
VLELDGVHTYYGDSHILQGVSLTVDAGQVVAILGRNGAGKTTLVRTVIGFTPARRGTVRFKDADITRWAPFRAVERGMALVPQGRRVFRSLTVLENLDVARRDGGAWTRARVLELFPRLAERGANRADKLSGGEQQMLAIGRALMANPRLLLLDEPSMGLAPVLVEQIFDTIKNINRQGTTILLVEQNAAIALEVAHRGYVLETGTIVLSGTATELSETPEVRRAYLGE